MIPLDRGGEGVGVLTTKHHPELGIDLVPLPLLHSSSFFMASSFL